MNGTLVNVATVLAGPGAKNINQTNMVAPTGFEPVFSD